jgi:hypothetical protein
VEFTNLFPSWTKKEDVRQLNQQVSSAGKTLNII